MAKKKSYPVAMDAYEAPPVPDNNKASGLLSVPDYSTDPSAGNYTKGRFDFAGLVAQGESANIGDINVQTANGVSSSKGQGKNCQYNWVNGSDGEWNKNCNWSGGNLTGM